MGTLVWSADLPRATPRRRRPRVAAPATLAGLAVGLWATNALAGSAALAGLSVPQQLSVQFTSAFAVLMVARRVAPPAGADVRGSRAGAATLAVVGVAGTISLQYLSFATAPLVQANIVAYSWPLLVAVALAASASDRAALRSLVLAAAGFAGVILMLTGGGAGGRPTWGLAAAAGSAACMALYTFAAPTIAGRERDALLWATGVGAAAATAATLATGLPEGIGASALLAAYTGVGPMAAGYLMWTRAMASASGRSLAPLAYATPLLSTTLLLATGHPLAGLGLVGAAITLAATVAVLAGRR